MDQEADETVKLDILFSAAYYLLKSGLPNECFHELVSVCVKNQAVVQFCRERSSAIVAQVASAVNQYFTDELEKDLANAKLYGLVFVRCGAFDDAVYVTYVKNNGLIAKYLVTFKKDMPCTCSDALTNKLQRLGLGDPYKKFAAATVDRDCFHGDEIAALISSKAVITFGCVVYKLESVLGRALQKSMQDDPQVAIIVNLCNMLKNLALADDLDLGDAMFFQKGDASTFFNYKTLVTIHDHWLDIVTKLDRIVADSLVEDDQQVISVILSTLKSTSFVVNLAFYIELFYCIHRVSEKILAQDMPTYQIVNELEGTSDTIRHYTSTGGSRVEEVLDVLRRDVGKYRGVAINWDLNQEVFVSTMQRACGTVADIVEEAVRRTGGVVRQFSVLDPKLWPTDGCELDGYGFDVIKSFVKKYGESLLENVDVFQEWGSYKRTVQNSFAPELRNDFNRLAARVVSSYGSMYPGVGALLNAAVLPCPASQTAQMNAQLLLLNDAVEETKNTLLNGPQPSEWNALPTVSAFLRRRRADVKLSEEELRGAKLPLNTTRRLFDS